MADPTLANEHDPPIPGIDTDIAPLLGVGLGLTGLALGLRPRLAPVPLALTALAAALYRDPVRNPPEEPQTLFAPADGLIAQIDEMYEHRFIHSDCVRLVILSSPIDVPFVRSPMAATVGYLASVSGEHRPVHQPEAAEHNDRSYVGLETALGPVLIVQISGPLARRRKLHTALGAQLQAGERIATRNNHGTGCTLSSAIASFVARGETVENSVRHAKAYITGAIRAGLETKMNLIKTAAPQLRAKRVDRRTGLVRKALELDLLRGRDGMFRWWKQVLTGQRAVDMPGCPQTTTDGGGNRAFIGGKIPTHEKWRTTEAEQCLALLYYRPFR